TNPAGTITVTALAGTISGASQTFTNNATLTGSDSSNNSYSTSASANVTVTQTSLSLGKTVDQSILTSLPGNLTYTLNPSYTGSSPLTNSYLVDPLPAGLNSSGITVNQGGSVGMPAAVNGGGTVPVTT